MIQAKLSNTIFKSKISDLEQFFSREYKDVQLKFLYQQVKFLDSEQWEECCKRLCTTYDRLPTIHQILDANLSLLQQAKQSILVNFRAEMDATGEKPCQLCDYTGLLQAVETSSGVVYAFRCTGCQGAELMGLSWDIPSWKPELSEGFQPLIPKITKLAIENKNKPFPKEEKTIVDEEYHLKKNQYEILVKQYAYSPSRLETIHDRWQAYEKRYFSQSLADLGVGQG